MASFKKRVKQSVQYRLSVSLFIAIVIAGLLSGGLTFFLALDEAHELQDNTLSQIANLLSYAPGRENLPELIRHSMEGDNEAKIFVEYLSSANHVMPASDVHFMLPAKLNNGFQDISSNNHHYRIFIHQLSPEMKVIIGQRSDARDEIAFDSALRSLIPFVILLPIFLVMAVRVIRKAFFPLRNIANTLIRRSDGDLTPVVDTAIPDEIQPFVDSINGLLNKVETTIRTQKRFIADAAHELRTPLTALSLQAERLSASEMSEEAQKRLSVLRTGLTREKVLLEQLLSLAREQQDNSQGRWESVSVITLFRDLIESVIPLADEKYIDIGIPESAEMVYELVIMTEKSTLYTALKNITENAIRYIPEHGQIDLSVRYTDHHMVIEVEDNGPGIPDEEKKNVFDAFYRLEGTTLPGSGLGLSIVKACIIRLGGTVTLEKAIHFPTGLLVRICLPV
ncbi:sensor histidine kinase [Salmonella enterica]|nr:sensor histidine kinase [Salmonella enterica]